MKLPIKQFDKSLRAEVCLCLVAIAVAVSAAAKCSGANVLLVTQGASADAEETSRQTAFEGWGHTVTTIQDSSDQATFDASLGSSDLVYVPHTIQHGELGYKLRTATCGVVNEHINLEAEFGFTSGDGYTQSWHTIDAVDNSHAVTSNMASGDNVVTGSSQSLTVNSTTFATGLEVLGTMNYGGLSIGVLEAGATLADTYNGNSTASGRRVRLPWGSGTWANLNATGLQLSRDSLEWASGGTTSLRLHLELEESSGTVAVNSEPAGGDGTYVGSPNLGVTAKRGKGTELSQDAAYDRIELPATILDCQTQVTVAWWMKTGKTGQQAVLSGARGGQANSMLLFFSNSSTFRYYFNGAVSQINLDSIADSRWHHYIFTHDTTTGAGQLFIDGASVGSFTSATSSGYQIDTGGLMIGEEQDSVGGGFVQSQAFSGAIDDFRIYNYVIGAAEIAEAYGLLGHWTFDEGSGLTIADSSPNANDATISNGSPRWIEGIREGAFYFNGSCDAITDSNFEPPEQGTVALWIRPDGPPASRARPIGVSNNFELWQDPDGLVRFDILADGNVGGFTTTRSLADPNRWRHLVGTYDLADDSYAIYIDGQLHKSGTSSVAMTPQSAAQLSFGTRTGVVNRFTGALDDVRIYNYKLSNEDIAEVSGFIGHWKLDEVAGSTASDESLAANHGSYVGGPILGTSAVRKYGTEFTSSSQQITVPPSETLNNLGVDGGSLSIAMWVKPSTPDSFDRPLIHKGATSQQRTPYLALNFGDNRVEYAVSANGNWNAGSTSTKELPADEWSHLILVKDGRDYYLYIDGELDSSRSVSGVSYGNEGTLYVGATPYRAGDPCVVDDIHLYNYAITEQQIAEIYGLVARWKLDETSGYTAYDSSGMQHHATLTGADTWTGGKDGGGHEFDYSNGEDYFTAPTSETLNRLNESSHSFSTWFKPLSTPPGSGSASDAYYGMLVKQGYHIGVYYNNSNKFIATSYLDGNSYTGTTTWSELTPAGAFYHVAGVLNQDEGIIQIFLNGQLIDTQTFTPGAAMQSYGSNPWRLGIASPSASNWGWAAHGVLDDARLYNRAIMPGEVLRLYQSGQTQGLRIIRWVEVR